MGQVELDGYEALNAPSPVPYFPQAWLTCWIFDALGF